MLFFYADGWNALPLGKVGIVDRSPSPALPKGWESILAVFEEVGWNALPLGRVGEGPLCLGNSVGVAFSRRRYPRQDDGLLFFDGYYQIEYNAFG